jgi:V/A-type H+-transporting ATPase subunit K
MIGLQDPTVWAIAGGALAAGLAASGSAIGCGISGCAAAGVITEDPEKFGRVLLLQALPGTQGFYGFVAMFLILGKLAKLEALGDQFTLEYGIQLFFAGLPAGIAEFISAIYQGKVCAYSTAMVGKRPAEFGKGMIFGVVVETYAVLGLLATILLVNKIGADLLAGK